MKRIRLGKAYCYFFPHSDQAKSKPSSEVFWLENPLEKHSHLATAVADQASDLSGCHAHGSRLNFSKRHPFEVLVTCDQSPFDLIGNIAFKRNLELGHGMLDGSLGFSQLQLEAGLLLEQSNQLV